MVRRWYRPRAFAVALTLFGIALFTALGLWQLRRAHEKVELFAALAGAAQQAPVALAEARREASAGRYPRVQVGGRYDPLHAYVLDNQVQGGRTGVRVFGIFEPADGSTPLLVDRGFLARDARGQPSAIPLPPPGTQSVIALYAPPPGSGLRLGGNPLPRQATWPKTSIYIDLAEIAADLGHPLDPRMLRLAPEPGSVFGREWTPELLPPQRHLGYAATWFAFAALALVLFVIRHWRNEEN